MKARKAVREGDRQQKQAYRMRMPGFVGDQELGLGDFVKRVTYSIGIRPCGACERRAAVLNRWMVFSR